ncbi:unnamed protein product [Phytophthora fragariaefolia]|uniref:Unnamed protein product n=1 Tax=Phytophthora fragariaefolia TaxID=1490495 RepID=A0A9W7D3F4_9STRA|nr:unnamed protein product [Phytophthora fragariaefolia]
MVLFFDGGSRGNPGPGGAGTVIVRIGDGGHLANIIWMASISYSDKITNNMAEYHGLLTGLRYAARHQMSRLNVVGDSQLILTQLQKRKFPRARHLQSYFTQCRTLADTLMVTNWGHHLRSFNKMADHLANIAMDTRKIVQVAARKIPRLPPAWSPVLEFLQGDVGHWLDNILELEALRQASHHVGVD